MAHAEVQSRSAREQGMSTLFTLGVAYLNHVRVTAGMVTVSSLLV
jgi:1-aminocyclopropane-1-carboxylate deaminase/D-cysteine desulfhydrase-like pyridoxal-dependent ACC family enzyme